MHMPLCRTRCCIAIEPRPSGSSRVRRSAACPCSLSGPSSCTFTGSPSSHLHWGMDVAVHATCKMQICYSTLRTLTDPRCVPFQLYLHLSASSDAQRSAGKHRSVDVVDELAPVMTSLRDAALLIRTVTTYRQDWCASLSVKVGFTMPRQRAAWRSPPICHQQDLFSPRTPRKLRVAQQNRGRPAAAPLCS